VHFHHNIFSHLPWTKVREIVAMLKAIHAGEDIGAARQVQLSEKLRGLRLTKAVKDLRSYLINEFGPFGRN
jgi:putative transposase